MPQLTEPTDEVVQAFHDLFYRRSQFSSWLGVAAQKNPCDLYTYQEIIFDTSPDLLIETGTQTGGSAWFFANVMDLVDRGSVVTVDINGDEQWPNRPSHDRVNYFLGSSTDDFKSIVEFCEIRPAERVMVSLDSDHSYEHVLRECELYGPLVTPGCYMVVEDTNVTGAAQAAAEFVAAYPDEWEVDLDREEKYLLTFHPGGWLRRR